MKILERTPDRLRISTAWPTALIVVFCSIWGLAALMCFRSHAIQGERAEDGTVNLQVTSRFFGLPLNRWHFEGVSGARLEIPVDPNHREGFIPGMNRVLLVTKEGNVPFSRVQSSERRRLTNLAGTLDALVQDPSRDSFRFVAPPGWIGWLLLGVFAFTIVTFVFAEGGNVLIDKQAGVVAVTKMGIPKPRPKIYPLNEVRGFFTNSVQSGGGQSRSVQHWLVLTLASGREVSIANFSMKTCHAISNTLDRFIASGPAPARFEPPPPRETRTFTVPLAGAKICVICGSDCSTEPRFQDDQGRYYHQRCHPAHGA
jgi:hypothetical protein